MIDDTFARNYCDIFDNLNLNNPFKILYGYQKNRMWETYADNFEGLCLVFDRDKITKEVDNNYNNYEYNYVSHQKFPLMGINDINFNNQNILEETERYLKKKYFIKHYDYKEENEYRIMILSDNEYDKYISIKNSLKAVIISSVFPKKNLSELKAKLKAWNDVQLVEYKIYSIKQ